LKKFKVVLLVLLVITIIVSGLVVVANEDITVIRNKKVEVVYNGQTQKFSDVTGKVVYPLSYEGTTYLPVRAISSLFQVPIQWNSITKTVSLGSGELGTKTVESVDEFISGTNENITVILNNEITIELFGVKQCFEDVTGKVVYPLSYEGTIYLPVRAISNLFDAEIEWDGKNNVITISRFFNGISQGDSTEQASWEEWAKFCGDYAEIQSTVSVRVAEEYGKQMIDDTIKYKPSYNEVQYYILTGKGYDSDTKTWKTLTVSSDNLSVIAITSGNRLELSNQSFDSGEWVVTMRDGLLLNTIGVINPDNNINYAAPTITQSAAQALYD
jgi:hypothetical protein